MHDLQTTKLTPRILADDNELLKQLNEANFIGVFVGIESPDAGTLIATRKKQNIKRDIAQSVHKIYAAGLYVTAGFHHWLRQRARIGRGRNHRANRAGCHSGLYGRAALCTA